ncbi:MAG: threonine synthase [Candidatus Helarchaeota archaeon]
MIKISVHQKCIKCGEVYPIDQIIYYCEKCGALLDIVHDLEQLKEKNLKELFDKRWKSHEFPYMSGVWRYKELILPVENKYIISRPEGNTNLYSSPSLLDFTGCKWLRLKHEGENPTGSFKDRGMTTGVTQANFLGSKVVACASTGNTSASLAAYGRFGGFKVIIFIPEGKIAYGKLSQALAYGAMTFQIRGNFDDAMALVQDASAELNLYLLNSVNAFRLEGQKGIVFELLQQLDWEVPDWLVCPGGNLGNSSAFGKGFKELQDLGIISDMPKVAVIQAAGSNPLYLSYKTNFQKHIEVENPDTIATAIKIGKPVNYLKAVRTIRWTNGVVEQVTEQEILDAKAQVDGAGIGAEPASCATVAGIKKLIDKGVIDRKEKVTGILTGNLLKDPDATINYHLDKIPNIKPTYANKPIVIDANLDALKEALRKNAPRQVQILN